MRCLFLADSDTDLAAVIRSCGAEVTRIPFHNAVGLDLSPFDAYVVCARGRVLDARVRAALEEETNKGKRIFTEALNSWGGVYSAAPAETTRSRLIVTPALADGAAGDLCTGDLLDDGCNSYMRPWYGVKEDQTLLVYREHVTAHRRLNGFVQEKDDAPALWTAGGNVMMCPFELHDFNRARFSPRMAWRSLIAYVARWITGVAPAAFPAPVVTYGISADLTDGPAFEEQRKEAIRRGVTRLKGFLVDGGRGGILEGLRHNITPDGAQAVADTVRTDCCGEAAGAFGFYAALTHSEEYRRIARDLFDFVFGPMQVKGGAFDGMLRWTDTGWQVCYGDDAARAMLPALYECLFLNDTSRFPAVCRALDFLVKTTAKDGCRVSRTDMPALLGDGALETLSEAEHGTPSAHYNAYYHAALLLAYRAGGDRVYFDVARRGLETIMSLYPDTRREQSETEELCRLILPLAALYESSREEKHLEMLRRVAKDLTAHRHPFGGYCEWDTGYKAACSRESRGECSLLTENGDPVADLLYSNNWLPAGFAYAYRVTGDRRFYEMWRGIAAFFIKTQARSENPQYDGLWSRAFDMELGEVYGCPHDVGWAANCSETGWTDAEILMGLMLPDIFGLQSKRPFIKQNDCSVEC